ncbi:hypothetical protein FHU23_003867, partial [Clostridium saccharobutylicum]|nr:hypothetical protein [Clostridium saccharobutylicum]MBA8791736.1 hypothetical protein [Clostridium saccharobutylicum]MBA8898475.1 hypothetical protein [Clostridium saccharobutylicum]MBA8995897.1 hypothetical protein [Clostridium saccharobutylicum]NSB49965.1 hypothetical protein [Clostridium saccharobutylicum]
CIYYILFNFQRPFSFTTFVVTFCFFLSPSSDLLSISLDLKAVNNFFHFFKALFQRLLFRTYLKLFMSLSDVFYLNINLNFTFQNIVHLSTLYSIFFCFPLNSAIFHWRHARISYYIIL